VGHADFQHELEGGIMLQFFWAPYPANLTALLTRQLLLEGKAAAAGGAAAAGTAGVGDEDAKLEKEEQQVEQQKEQEEETIRKEQGEKGEQQQQAEQEEDQEANGQEPQQQQKEPEKKEQATATRKRRRLQGLKDPAAQPEQQPSLVLLSSTLWHMLHIRSADDFAAQLKKLAAACGAYVDAASAAQGAAAAPRLLLASSTETFPNRMRTEVKQQRMTPFNVDSYNQALAQVG
jgi:flagellar biosynthesis GTPase FlhF